MTVNGGLKDNAIPRETTATVLVADEQKARAAAEQLDAALRNEYRVTDKDVTLTVTSGKAAGAPMDADSTARCVCFLSCAPNGIYAMASKLDLTCSLVASQSNRVR